MNQKDTFENNEINEMEKRISEYWDKINLLEETYKNRDKNKSYVFYEGPPTANGKPGIHHVSGRTLKDSVLRYKIMQGYYVNRKAGWDTHGLPVEIETEKRLGLHDKQDIEQYGVEKFNKECRESVFTYESMWRDMTKRMAYLIDLDHPYITLDNDYIESVWWILDRFFKQGLIYEGHKILPFCTRCGTGLASHEVAQGYENIKTETVFVKFRRKDKNNEYFLAWTTTPWTLPSNVSLTVNEDFEYTKIKNKESGEIFYIAKSRLNDVLQKDIENWEVLEEMKGKDLEFIEYEQLLPFIKTDKKAFYITCAPYVTMDDGTGIVHTAPAFGEDDHNTGKRYDLPILNPVGEDGKFIDTPFKGKFVMDADPDIIDYLKKENKVYKKQKIEHNYPHCWRCHTPLIYYAKPSWYIEVTKFKEKLIENNNKVKWYPPYVGEKRFGNWLENLNDWALSRSRYWGTPLNIWRCEECGHTQSIGSREELKQKSLEDIDENIELHRPYVDNVHIRCEKCGADMARVPDVIDVWFDSGSMPFSQMHYPFENKEEFENNFPADFICEGIDQTRGWFYSLLAISTFIMSKAPYKNVLVNDLVLDKDGKKMSKHKGNTVNPFEMFDKYGADAVRWYLLYVSPAWSTKKFDEEGLREVNSKFFNTLRNVYNFFNLYLNTDKINIQDLKKWEVKYQETDLWIKAKYNKLIKLIEKDMQEFELTRVVRNIQDFVVEDLSNWYIRRSRRRFWNESLDESKKAVYKTTFEILLGVSKLIAPFAPYSAEDLYLKLGDKKSVHIESYPESEEAFIDEKLIYKMDLLRDLVKLGRAGRELAKIKVRIPINEVIISADHKADIGALTDLIKEELNVKNVVFEEDLSKYISYGLKPNFKVAGAALGSKIKSLQSYLKNADAKDFIEKISSGDLLINLDGEDVDIKKDYVDIQISAKEGFNIEMQDNLFIILDTNLNEELVNEGYVREFISKIQMLRKKNDYEVLDEINIICDCDQKLNAVFKSYENTILKETVAKSFSFRKLESEEVDLNGKSVKIEVNRD